YLVNRVVFRKPGDATSVIVDAEGYRGRREDSLTDLARRLAEKAVRSGRPVPVEPMNAHDRRIVHMALADHPDVTTESEGEGMAVGWMVPGALRATRRTGGARAAARSALVKEGP